MTDVSDPISLGKKILRHIKATPNLDIGIITVPINNLKTTLFITQGEAYSYEIAHAGFNLALTFHHLVDDIDRLATILHFHGTTKDTFLENIILKLLSDMIYGSNKIENAGADLKHTRPLCLKVFRGEDTFENDLQKGDKYYTRIQKQRLDANLPSCHTDILRSYCEIVQHAKAADYIINKLCIDGENPTENIILETYRIVTYKVDAEGASWSEYSGVYRTDELSAGFHTFASPEKIPGKMKGMIRQYDSEIGGVVKTGIVDPSMLAAKYSHIFVNIHPFLDGNGRMSRLILNSILLKLGIGFPISLSGRRRVLVVSIRKLRRLRRRLRIFMMVLKRKRNRWFTKSWRA